MVLRIILTIIFFKYCNCSELCLNQNSLKDPQPDLCSSFSDAAIDLRVVGGASIDATDAPWHAIVSFGGNRELDSNKILGGGSLITSTLVLTAAHLFWTNSRDGHVCPKHARELETAEECDGLPGGCPTGCHRVTSDNVELYFGVTSVIQRNPPAYTVNDIEIHGGYDKKSISNNIAGGHDIAIVKMSRSVSMSDAVQTICLPVPDLEKELTASETDVSVNGFGRDGKSGYLVADTLQQGCVYLVASNSCREAYSPFTRNSPFIFPEGKITGDQICASGDGVDSCQGDSGGGLVKNREGTNIIIGITSLGDSSCRSVVPGLYTNVFSHLDWIEEQMKQNCTGWSGCNATCSAPGYRERKCTGTVADGRPWFKDEIQGCHDPNCVEPIIDEGESGRLVVLGGWIGNVSQSRTVFMEDCLDEGSQIPDLSRNISHGVGAYIPLRNPVLLFCGGWVAGTGPTRECFEYRIDNYHDIREVAFASPSQWHSIENMVSPRANAAISVIARPVNGGFQIWITGGRSSRRVILDTTEILEKTGSVWTVKEGPKLRKPLSSHCAITVSQGDSNIYVIGGARFDSDTRKFVMTNSVDVYPYQDEIGFGVAKQLAGLNTARSGHACTLLAEGDGPKGIMVAGGQSSSRQMLDSVEYMNLQRKEWRELTPLPRKLTGAKMVLKLGLPVLIGGVGFLTEESSRSKKLDDLIFSKDILSYEDREWSKVGEVIETVAYHEVLLIDSAICLDIKREERKDNSLKDDDCEDPRDCFIDIR